MPVCTGGSKLRKSGAVLSLRALALILMGLLILGAGLVFGVTSTFHELIDFRAWFGIAYYFAMKSSIVVILLGFLLLIFQSKRGNK
jgi:hypothetical protein